MMALNIKDPATEQLAADVASLAAESKPQSSARSCVRDDSGACCDVSTL